MNIEAMVQAAYRIAALEAAERAALPNGKPSDTSKSVMLKSLRQWMKEMRRQTALRGGR